MTSDQYKTLCELMNVRKNSPSSEVARMVLVNGLPIAEARKRCNMSYNAAWQAVQKRTKAIRLIESISKTKIL